jgi:prevent-host-death family protein
MEITTKELRIHPGKILEQVAHGHEVTVTFRGKPLAKIVPIQTDESTSDDSLLFGLWRDNHPEVPVETVVRDLRRGRSF